MLTEERRAEFREDVARLRLNTQGSRWDGPLRVTGIVLMVAGIVATVVVYNVSLTRDDFRDLLSDQILTLVLLGVVVVGSALFLLGALARLLRLWLLRQLYEAAARHDSARPAVPGSTISEAAGPATSDAAGS